MAEFEPPQILPQPRATAVAEKKKDELNDDQKAFVDALFEAGGDADQAIALCPQYSSGSKGYLMRRCAKEITSRATKFLAAHTAQASMKLVNAMTMGDDPDTPVSPFVKQQIKAAESILDRAGVQSALRIEADIKTMTGVVFLPDKQKEQPIVIDNE